LRLNYLQRREELTGHRFFLLFLFLLATLLIYPYAENTRFGNYAVRVLGSAVIVISVYAVNFRRSVFMITLLLALPAFAQKVTLPDISINTQSILRIVLSILFDVLIVVIISRHVFARNNPNSETIFGALCIYLLMGFTFASLYGLATAFDANAFFLDPRINFHTSPERFDFIYYSFGTITSLGAAGVTPVSSSVRALSILEAILGVLYLAVLIARLMGAYRMGEPSGTTGPPKT
jgi:hypothetical protein